jgi:hypothetical protein
MQRLPIETVTSYAQYAMAHSREQRRKLQTLLRRYRQVVPILVDENCAVVVSAPVTDEPSTDGRKDRGHG